MERSQLQDGTQVCSEAGVFLVLIRWWNFCPTISLEIQDYYFSSLVLIRKAEKSNYFIKEKSQIRHCLGFVQNPTRYRSKWEKLCDDMEGKLKCCCTYELIGTSRNLKTEDYKVLIYHLHYYHNI